MRATIHIGVLILLVLAGWVLVLALGALAMAIVEGGGWGLLAGIVGSVVGLCVLVLVAGETRR